MTETLTKAPPIQPTRSSFSIRPAIEYALRFDVRLVLRNATSMGGTAVVTAAFGVVFWSLAARSHSPAAVGLAAAAISACTLLSNFSVLGLGTLMISELGRPARERAELLTTCLAVSGVLGIVLGSLLGLVGPALLEDLRPLQSGIWTVGLFALFVAGTTVGQVLDQFAVGLLHGELQFGRNTFYAICRLALLALASVLILNDQALTIFAAWPLGNALSLICLAGAVFLATGSLPLARPRWRFVRRLGWSALSHHALNLAIQAPSQLLPLVVTILLSATANAYFYPAWMLSSVAFVPQTALTITLFAVAAREPEALVSRARLTIALSAIGGILAIGVVWLAGEHILEIFGKAYVEQANGSLQLLILAVLPIVVKTHYVAILRIKRRVVIASVTVAAGALAETAAAAIGALLGGIHGLALGWLIALCLEAAYMAPTVWHTAVPARARRRT